MNGDEVLKVETGDFQTPREFAYIICQYLNNFLNIKPTAILEPTCGLGNFLVAAKEIFIPQKIYGIEKNADYYDFAKNREGLEATLFNEDLFAFDFELLKTQTKKNHLLVIGNPPWVSNSVLSALQSSNLPPKTNFKQLKGLDALTGSSNFDISEYMFLQLIDAFSNTNTTIALLCKTIVARNVFKELKRNNVTNSKCTMVTFNANKVFNVNVEACLFIVELEPDVPVNDKCIVYSLDAPKDAVSAFGYKNNKFYSSLENDSVDLDGECCFEWRQGVKHDCSKIMELTKSSKSYINGNQEEILLEEMLVFPLIKSSHIKKPIINKFKKHVIVTQKKSKDDTSYIAKHAPFTWEYLNRNSGYFDKRRSSIYKNAPLFSMFGVGDYSYSEFKVGVSGFYKTPLFSLCYADKPVMFDDTCYFLSFEEYELAYIAMLILNSELVQSFLKSIAFVDSKRPFTKKVLERIDFYKIINNTSLQDLIDVEVQLHLPLSISESMYQSFKSHVLCVALK